MKNFNLKNMFKKTLVALGILVFAASPIFPVLADAPVQPSNISPANGAIGVDLTQSLIASPFVANNPDDTHCGTTWSLFHADESGQRIPGTRCDLAVSGTSVGLDYIDQFCNFIYDQGYVWEVTYYAGDMDQITGATSSPTSFNFMSDPNVVEEPENVAPAKPSNISPISDEELDNGGSLVGSAFVDENEGDIHSSTNWRVDQLDDQGQVIVGTSCELGTSVELVELNLGDWIDYGCTFVEDARYQWKLKYTDQDDVASEWSESTTFIYNNELDDNGSGDGEDDSGDDNDPIDTDNDGVPDEDDNCPNDANPDQLDTDGDGIGDVCDTDDGAGDDEDDSGNTGSGGGGGRRYVDTTAPADVEDVEIEFGQGEDDVYYVLISWDDSSDSDLDGVRVYRSDTSYDEVGEDGFELVGEADSGDEEYRDEFEFELDSTYFYIIRPYDDDDNENDNTDEYSVETTLIDDESDEGDDQSDEEVTDNEEEPTDNSGGSNEDQVDETEALNEDEPTSESENTEEAAETSISSEPEGDLVVVEGTDQDLESEDQEVDDAEGSDDEEVGSNDKAGFWSNLGSILGEFWSNANADLAQSGNDFIAGDLGSLVDNFNDSELADIVILFLALITLGGAARIYALSK